MSNASDYFKYYEIQGADALAADIEAGQIAYIAGGRVIGQGLPPSGSLTAFYRTQDATITPSKVAAWKEAFGKFGKVIGTSYVGLAPATGGIFGPELRSTTYAATGDTFNLTAR